MAKVVVLWIVLSNLKYCGAGSMFQELADFFYLLAHPLPFSDVQLKKDFFSFF
jgi:hypothetical protein